MAYEYTPEGLQLGGPGITVDEQHASDRFDLERWLRLLRRRWWVVAGCFIVCAAAAASFSLSSPKMYTATASLLFRQSQIASDLLGASASYNPDPARTAETNVKLVHAPGVAGLVSKDLGGRLTPLAVSQAIGASPEGQSDFVAVSATDKSPKFAAQLANLYARDFIAYRRSFERAQISQVVTSLQSQLNAMTPEERATDAGATLRARITQLLTVSDLQAGDAELDAPASVPISPSSPKTKLNVALGGMLGLLLGFGVALLLERLNRRVRDVDELCQIYGSPVLTSVPESDALRASGRRARSNGHETDAFDMLRARLRFYGPDGVRSLLVTSCGPQEGKSTVAWNLARSTALSFDGRVLLIEADLRRPSLAAVRGLRHQPGLSEVLSGQCGYPAALQKVEVTLGTNGSTRQRWFDVIVAGPLPPNPAELIESDRMTELMNHAAASYDFVVVDCGPALLVPDALALMTQVVGVLVVTHLGGTTRDAATRLRNQLSAANIPLLGLVANRVKESRESGYYYGYSAATPD